MNNHDIQAELQPLLDELAKGIKGYGVQVAAYYQGKQVINAWSGTRDAKTETPVDSQTLFNGQSCAKGVTATVIHILVQQGKLAYDDKVSSYWPEFGVNGKDNITVRQVLCHKAGIPQMPAHTDMALICNWDAMVHEIEQLSPIWEPGTQTGYHGLTFGWILGETAARSDGRSFARIVREEICRPLGIEHELYFGAPAEVEERIAVISGEEMPLESMPDDMLLKKVLPISVLPVRNPGWNAPSFHQAVIPAAGALMTANALARLFASFIGKGVDGVRLLNQAQIREAVQLQTNQTDNVFMQPTHISLGYYLGYPGNQEAIGESPTVFGNAGMGGMVAFADPDNQFSIAILKNYMLHAHDDHADIRITDRVRELLGLR